MVDGFDEVAELLSTEPEIEGVEAQQLYTDIEYFAGVADVYESAGEPDKARYFRELAVDRFRSFGYVIQLEKDDE